MKVYIIAGEASGDLHGSNLVKELKKQSPDIQLRGWGGDLMSKAGVEVVKHYRDLAFMGFLEVVMNLRTIQKNFDFCKTDITEFQPDAVILIDYPGFNLRMAKFIKEKGIKVFYYISPQIWAWNQKRVHKIKRLVDRMFVILPFEKEFYSRFDYEVDFVGHPLLDAIHSGDLPSEELKIDNQDKVVAVLPGSRKQEIQRMLPTMLSVVNDFPEYQFVLAGAPSVDLEYYESFNLPGNVQVIQNQTYSLLKKARAALVTSGTATLETALFKVPEVVCYSGNYLSYLLARMLIKVKFISLVNLVMDRLIVVELIQSEFNKENLLKEMKLILEDGSYRDEMLKNLDELSEKLGGQGASEKAASLMIQHLNK